MSEEVSWKSDLLPPPLVNEFAESEPKFVSDYISELAQGGIDAAKVAEVSASKWRYGRRPVALLPLVNRVMYRAIVNYLDDDLIPLDRSLGSYQQFQLAPTETSAKYIIVTDLSNFHSSIPTERLARELVERTGRWEPVEWLRQFYLSIYDGQNGIPHGSPPSTRIAEVYANELHRRLALRGLKVWRYADDFRIAASNAFECVSALDTFDEEARSLGLSINERKTYYVPRERYLRIINEPHEKINEISEEVQEDLTLLGDYDEREAEIEAGDPELLTNVARQLIDYWLRERVETEKHDIGKELETVRLVRLAIEIFTLFEDDYGLDKCVDLLRLEPQLTPSVCNYLTAISETDPERITTLICTILDKVPLTKWQHLWLLHVISSSLRITRKMRILRSWMYTCANDSLEIVRSQAIWALARTTDLSLDTWSAANLQSTRFGSPYISAALNGVSGRVQPSLRPTDKLDRKISEWASIKVQPF